MMAGLQTLVFLLAVVAFVAFIASRSGLASPILLVAAGVLIAVAPGVPPLCSSRNSCCSSCCRR